MADLRYFKVSTTAGDDRFYCLDSAVTYRPVSVWLDGRWQQTVFDTVEELVTLLAARGVVKDGAREVSAEDVPKLVQEQSNVRITLAEFGGAPR